MIEGRNINLTALDQECFDLTLQWINDPKLREMIGTVFPVSALEHKRWFENHCTDPLNKTFGIRRKDNGKLIGIIGSTNLNLYNRNAEAFEYIGDAASRAEGLGTDALRTFVRFCFDQLNYHRLYGNLFAYNAASSRMLEKVGFSREGVLRQHLYRNGQYHDVVSIGINKGELLEEDAPRQSSEK